MEESKKCVYSMNVQLEWLKNDNTLQIKAIQQF